MSSQDDVRQILTQLQTTARDSTRDLAKTRAELAAKEREAKQAALTLREVESLPKAGGSGASGSGSGGDGEVRLYKSVGKMFMLESRTATETALKAKEKAAKEEATKLASKQKYLEVEIQNNQRALREVVKGLEQSGMA